MAFTRPVYTPKWLVLKTPDSLSELAKEADRRAQKWLLREAWWRVAHYTLLVAGSVLASLAGAAALADVRDGTVAGVLALAAAVFTTLAAALTPPTMAAGSGKKAAEYLALAGEVRQAVESDEEERGAYWRLLAKYHRIRTSPEPPLPTTGD
jgi:hypothetical protein